MILNTVGLMLKVEAALLLLPAIAALIYGESCLWSILISAAISLAAGFALTLLSRPKSQVIYAREGFITVALAWVAVSAVGALPFYISREIPSYIDAFFETVSGFTTTGASILANVEVMSRGLLFWRSFTHWVGGMGVLVFVMALVPSVTDRSIHIMRAEMPGPVVGKLMPRARDTASILYKIYVGMTLLQIILMWAGGMPLYESIVHAFGTAGTGGFGVKADSIAGYSPYLQWVITVFMLLFGVNFNLYYLLLIRRFRAAAQSSECWYYLGIVGVSIALITANILPMYESFQEALRLSAFQVASIVTTTGYATADFNTWPVFSQAILVILMFIGACAGSTGGGIKVARVVILCKTSLADMRKMLHPNAVTTVRFEGKPLSERNIRGVHLFLTVYILIFTVSVLLLSLERFDLITTFTAVASCMNNIGPGLEMVGPMGNFSAFSPAAKLLLAFDMLVGRLEIFPMLLLFAPSIWKRRIGPVKSSRSL